MTDTVKEECKEKYKVLHEIVYPFLIKMSLGLLFFTANAIGIIIIKPIIDPVIIKNILIGVFSFNAAIGVGLFIYVYNNYSNKLYEKELEERYNERK